MFIINLYKFLFGYVKLKIFGNFPERILNLCAKQSVTVWDIKRHKDFLLISVMIKDFRNFRRLRGKSGVKVKIVSKNGLPIILKKYKLRIGALTGIIIFFSVLYILSCFVWQIEVVGNKRVSENEILKICDAYGIRYGSYIKNIDTVLLKDKILLDSDNFAWGSINIEGCRVTVNITEIKENKPVFSPSNIVSSNNAIIKDITVTSGVSQVYIGQAVSKGDMLISGTVDIGDKTEFIRAKGSVIGEIEEKIIISKKYNQNIKRLNGRQKNKYVLEFFTLKLPLYLGGNGDKYYSRYDCTQAKLLGTKIPIRLHKKELQYFDIIKCEFSREDLIRDLENQVAHKIKTDNLKNAIITAREIIDTNDGVTVKYTVKYQKNLCIEENLLFSTLN